MPHRIRHTIAKLSLAEKLCFIMLTLFLISLLPVCRLAFYAHPAGDDYAYGVAAHLAWTDTHSLSAVLAAAVSNVKGYYTSWQGTYSSIFLMSLQPAIFSQRLYFLTTFLMLFMVIGSIFSLFHVLFTRYIPLSRSLRLMLSLALSFLCVHVIDEGKSALYFHAQLHAVFLRSASPVYKRRKAFQKNIFPSVLLFSGLCHRRSQLYYRTAFSRDSAGIASPLHSRP